MTDIYLRKFASWLLAGALSLVPADVRPWGRAMITELDHIQSGWASLSWALGGMGVLFTEAVFIFFRKRSRDANFPAHRSMYFEEGFMRRITPLLAGVSAAAALLFLLAPICRRGMEIGLNSLGSGLQVGPLSDHGLLRLAAQARERKDAEAMAFVALRLWQNPESDELAQETVRLDPRLTWVYSILGSPYHSRADAETRVRQLEAWDPQNAMPFLVEADRILFRHWADNHYESLDNFSLVKGDPRWFEAMAAAFHAPTYDSYLARRLDLDRSVMRRWGLHNPMLISGAYLVPYMMGSNVTLYAKYLLDAGNDFELKGDMKQASQTYVTVAHFCEAVQLEGQTDFILSDVAKPQMEAYQHLRALAEKAGNLSERDLLSYGILRLKQQQVGFKGESRRANLLGIDAELVQFSSLLVLCSVCLILIWATWKVVQRRILHVDACFWDSMFSRAGMLGAYCLLPGALALYLSYLPFAEAYRNFALGRGVGGYRSMHLAFGALWIIPGRMQHVWYSNALGLYFWCVFLILPLLALMIVAASRIKKGLRFHTAG